MAKKASPASARARKSSAAKSSRKSAARSGAGTNVGSSAPVVKALDKWIEELRSLIAENPELGSVVSDVERFRDLILCRPAASGLRNHVPRPFRGRSGRS